jgi:hypothetical protein
MQKSGKFLALADGGRRTPGRTIAFGFDQLKSQGTTECRVAEPGGPLTLDRPAAPLESDWIGFKGILGGGWLTIVRCAIEIEAESL